MKCTSCLVFFDSFPVIEIFIFVSWIIKKSPRTYHACFILYKITKTKHKISTYKQNYRKDYIAFQLSYDIKHNTSGLLWTTFIFKIVSIHVLNNKWIIQWSNKKQNHANELIFLEIAQGDLMWFSTVYGRLLW